MAAKAHIALLSGGKGTRQFCAQASSGGCKTGDADAEDIAERL